MTGAGAAPRLGTLWICFKLQFPLLPVHYRGGNPSCSPAGQLGEHPSALPALLPGGDGGGAQEWEYHLVVHSVGDSVSPPFPSKAQLPPGLLAGTLLFQLLPRLPAPTGLSCCRGEEEGESLRGGVLGKPTTHKEAAILILSFPLFSPNLQLHLQSAL